MIDSNNILLITDYEEVATSILKKLVLLRKNDNISVTNIKNLKKTLEKSVFLIKKILYTRQRILNLYKLLMISLLV